MHKIFQSNWKPKSDQMLPGLGLSRVNIMSMLLMLTIDSTVLPFLNISLHSGLDRVEFKRQLMSDLGNDLRQNYKKMRVRIYICHRSVDFIETKFIQDTK